MPIDRNEVDHVSGLPGTPLRLHNTADWAPDPYILVLITAGVLIALVAWLPLALKKLPFSPFAELLLFDEGRLIEGTPFYFDTASLRNVLV